MAGEERLGLRARRFDQVSVLGKIRKTQERRSRSGGAEIFARTAQLEIFACDDESVGILENHRSRLRAASPEDSDRAGHTRIASRRVRRVPRTDVTAQVRSVPRLLESPSANVGDIHTHLDHGRPHQQLNCARQESGHHLRLFIGP